MSGDGGDRWTEVAVPEAAALVRRMAGAPPGARVWCIPRGGLPRRRSWREGGRKVVEVLVGVEWLRRWFV